MDQGKPLPARRLVSVGRNGYWQLEERVPPITQCARTGLHRTECERHRGQRNSPGQPVLRSPRYNDARSDDDRRDHRLQIAALHPGNQRNAALHPRPQRGRRAELHRHLERRNAIFQRHPGCPQRLYAKEKSGICELMERRVC